jgi:hypothetical protein
MPVQYAALLVRYVPNKNDRVRKSEFRQLFACQEQLPEPTRLSVAPDSSTHANKRLRA